MLPSIAPYALPGVSDLPDNRVNWSIHPDRAALLIHDMQHYFVRAFADHPAMISVVVDRILRLRTAADEAGVPVFYTAQPPNQAPDDRGLLTDFWGTGLRSDGTEEIVDALAPRPGDTVLTKWRYDAFVHSDFETRLAAQSRDQLMITGVYAHIGCLTTATSAFMRDIKPFLVADAMADFTPDDHRGALSYAAKRCGMVVDSASAETALGTAPPEPAGGRGQRRARESVGTGS